MTARRCAVRHGIRAWWLSWLAVVLAVATGCSGLPGAGPVLEGRAVDERVVPEVRIVVPPPAPGATPEQVVRGFLQAGAAFQEMGADGAPVANSYLAPGSVPRWRPTSSVTVFDRLDTVGLSAPSEDRLVASVRVVATVDDSGHYREVTPGTLATVTLGMVRIGGEWRIELPTDGFGLWLNTDDFGRLMSPYRVHYAASVGIRLVPDIRWFAGGPRLVTALTRAQLEPVPDYLVDAVQTGFPSGTALAVDAVTVEAGVAKIVLTATAVTADLAGRRSMWAQLVATLRAVPGVSAVSVEVQGAGPLTVPGLAGSARSAADVGYSAEPLPLPRTGWLRVGERAFAVELGRLDDLEIPASGTSAENPRPGPTLATSSAGSTGAGGQPGSTGGSLPPLPAAYVGFAVSPDGLDVAAVAAGGAELARWHERTRVTIPSFAASVLRPSYDSQGWLWVAGAGASGGGIWTFTTLSAEVQSPVPVRADWLDGRHVLGMAVSRDGTRLVLASETLSGGEPRLDVAGVVRDVTGRPAALAAPYRQADPLARLGDVTWVDDTTVAVLGSLGLDDTVRPWIVPLGQGVGLRRIGLSEPANNLIAPVEAARFLVSTGSSRGLVVLTQPPGMLVRVGGGWRRVEGATELAVQAGR